MRARRRRSRSVYPGLSCHSESLEPRVLLAAQLVKDINTSPAPGLFLGNVDSVGAIAYFVEHDGVDGAELWKTDGTTAGTQLVKDINPGPAGSYPAGFTTMNGITYFSAGDGSSGNELWRTDGTAAGTWLVKDIRPGPTDSNPAEFTVSGSLLYFFADDGVHGRALWRTDGTAAGTQLVNAGLPGQNAPLPAQPWLAATPDGKLFYYANTGVPSAGVYETDGTPGNTTRLTSISGGLNSNIVACGDRVYFEDVDGFVWTSDGTAAGTTALDTTNSLATGLRNVNGSLFYIHGGSVKTISGTTVSTIAGSYRNPTFLLNVNGTVYFPATSTTTGHQGLWKCPPGTTSPVLVVDNLAVIGAANVNGTLYLLAGTSTSGYRVYVSDGTASGTRAITLVNPGGSLSAPVAAGAAGSHFLFVNSDAVTGSELWASDGTAAGTGLLKDVYPGTNPSQPFILGTLGNKILFTATDGITGFELYASDGTAAGTGQLKDIGPGAFGGGIQGLRVIGDRAYFSAVDGTTGAELWTTDGTPDGTYRIADINPGANSSGPAGFTLYNGWVYFAADDGVHGAELWRTDGQPGSAEMVADINPGSAASSPTSLTVMNGLLYFLATTAANGTELWRTDGTAAGTQLVKDVYAGPNNGAIGGLTNVNGTLYFDGESDTVTGDELWKSDGTTAGTTLVADLTPGPGDTTLSDLTASNGRLFFSAQTAVGSGLWESDGTAAGTIPLPAPSPSGTAGAGSGFARFGTGVFFAADDGAHGPEPWITDGSPGGTLPLGNLNLTALSSGAANFLAVGEHTFFTASDAALETGLWLTDGTPAGTRLVKTFGTDPSITIADLTAVGDTLYFTVGDDIHGPQIWRSDGTEGGTFSFTNLVTNGITIPDHLTDMNGTLYFTAAGSVYRSDGTAAGTVPLCPFPQSLSAAKLTNLNGRLLGDVQGVLYALNDAQNALVQLGPGATPLNFVQYDPDELVVGDRMYYMNLGQAADGSTSGPSLYVTDGTPAGTMLIKSFGTQFSAGSNQMVWFHGRLYFTLGGYYAGFGDLWASDGTQAGTVSVTTKDQPLAQSLIVFNGLLYFSAAANIGESSASLFFTDGTGSGVMTVADLAVPTRELHIVDPVVAGGGLFFILADAAGNSDLWMSDGTAAGTRLDSMTPPGISPLDLIVSGAHLLFTADDGVHGREPWARDLAGNIGGTVYDDSNHDGAQGAGETGLAGVTIFVDTNGNGILDAGEISTVTDALGNYTLPDVPAGSGALIREVVPPGWRRTSPSGAAVLVPVITDQSVAGPTFGDVQISTVPMDFNYLLTLAQHYNQPGTFASGDLNGDDQVNFNDLLLLAQNYGHALPDAAPAAAASDWLLSGLSRKRSRLHP